MVKVGSALLSDPRQGLARPLIATLSADISALLKSGKKVLLVSSGAVAEGMTRLGWRTRPTSVHELQAAAAVGQMGLVQAYERSFSEHGRHTAVVLLTHDDLADRQRYLNARTTLRTLLDLGVVPIINENDSVATDEIRFGDNDTLAALVTNLLQADLLVLLTDIDRTLRTGSQAAAGCRPGDLRPRDRFASGWHGGGRWCAGARRHDHQAAGGTDRSALRAQTR